jgi:hypothetical protein
MQQHQQGQTIAVFSQVPDHGVTLVARFPERKFPVFPQLCASVISLSLIDYVPDNLKKLW